MKAPRKVYILKNNEYIEITLQEHEALQKTMPGYLDKKFVFLHDCLMEVSESFYLDFYKDKRRQKYLDECAAQYPRLSNRPKKKWRLSPKQAKQIGGKWRRHYAPPKKNAKRRHSESGRNEPHIGLYEGYGSHQLAKVLEEKGIRQHSGKPFTPNAVRRILKDELNRGFIVRGDVRSERVEELQIVSDELFFQAQKILEQRARKSEEKRIIAMTNKGKTLLNGNVYCAHCGCRLATSRYREEYTKSDGTKVNREYGRYICYHRSRGLNDCDGATTYNADKIDQSVIEAMRAIFARISGCPAEEKIQAAYKQSIASNHQMQRKLECDLQKDKTQLESLRLEIAKVLTGDSIFTQDDLMIAINALKSRIEEAESKLISLKSEDAEKKTVSEGIIPAYRQFKSWAEEFEAASWKAKKMIASQLFSRVEIGKGYTIHLVMNMTYQQFCEEWADPKDITATA